MVIIGLSIIVVLTIAIVIAAIALVKVREKKAPLNYFSMFIIGVMWIPAGIIGKNIFLLVLGGIATVVGLINVKKWKKNRRKWKDLNDKEKKINIILIALLGAMFLFMIGMYILFLIGMSKK